MFFKDLIPYAKLDTFKEEFLKQRSFINIGILAWIIGMLLMCIIFMSLMIVKVSSTAEYYQNQTAALRTRSIQSYNPESTDTTTPTIVQIDDLTPRDAEVSTTNFVQPKTQPLRSPRHNKIAFAEEMRIKLQQQQQQLQSQSQTQWPEASAQEVPTSGGDTAYLLERADSAAVYEQPIYGTWRTKARRPQPAFVAATAALMSGTGKHEGENTPQHLYEQLPRRASTVTPLKGGDLNDQIPRPPRLTSRRPSMMLSRRQYVDIPLNASYMHDEKPKPFHFPHEGPMPQEFKKGEGERAEVNNIQDILQQLHLSGGPSKVPQLMMMPTGLHIAGSFKNLKSSGITNFFRNRRNKKQLQFSFPMPVPMQLLKAYPTPIINPFAQPYQQRIAMDQFYPFKPRSPNDINLLAMQQQLNSNRAKNKKKNKQKKINQNSNLLLQHSNQRPFAADPYMVNYQQLLDLNAAQKSKPKRVPFKVNLDIFPVLPPAKDYKQSALILDETKAAGARPPSMLRNPFVDYYHLPVLPSAAALNYGQPYEMPHVQPQLVPFRFPTSSSAQIPLPQASNMVTFPDQLSKVQFPLNGGSQQTPFMPLENPNNNANQIMVHLNVFPKKPNTAAPVNPNNPFYGSTQNLNRHYADDVSHASPIEPRQQSKYGNVTSAPSQIAASRSDTNVDLQPLVDFEHPIVAAEVAELPQPEGLVSNKLDAENMAAHYDHMEGRSNFRYNESANVEQMASEAQTASLFRFPVEDLIQFQVADAL